MPTNGNAGAALAAYARAGGDRVAGDLPGQETPEINVRETAAYGAEVIVADGQIDECGRIVGEGAAQGRWFDCSTLKEPYRLEGKKVMGLELAEQFGWELPDAIFYPTGGGTGLIGMWKGFDELERIGLIGAKRPRMIAVQAAGCAPMVRALEEGDEFAERWEGAATMATGHPRAQGGRRLPDPPRGAGKRRRGDRGRGGGDHARRSMTLRAARRHAALPRGRGGAGRLAVGAGTAAGRQGRAGRPVQLRQRQQISAARPVAADGAGRWTWERSRYGKPR